VIDHEKVKELRAEGTEAAGDCGAAGDLDTECKPDTEGEEVTEEELIEALVAAVANEQWVLARALALELMATPTDLKRAAKFPRSFRLIG
jgi:hypothetical protein